MREEIREEKHILPPIKDTKYINDQYINYIHITKLKSLENVTIDFGKKRLTAIMGVNGAGKTTILHALACCYKPQFEKGENNKFSSYFTPSNYATWKDSSFITNFNYSLRGKDSKNIEVKYSKAVDRWSPRYDQRPARNVKLIGIKSCVPAIENESSSTFINFHPIDGVVIEKELEKEVMEIASYVLNISYTLKRSLGTSAKSRRRYIGVISNEHGEYTSLTMGAGEQRAIEIIEIVASAPKYSLILIDEIDLLLHVLALKKLIEKLSEIADKRKLQIIFTTHSLVMAELDEFVEIQYLKKEEKIFTISDYISPDCYYGLTGDETKPITIFVEDSLSKAIINNICSRMKIKRYVNVHLVGAASNIFSAICGLEIAGKLTENMLAVLDGDEYITIEDKKNQICKYLTGSEEWRNEQRKTVIKSISQYNLPAGFSPEQWIREIIISSSENSMDPEGEIVKVMKEIHAVDDNHKFFSLAISRLGYDRTLGEDKIVALASNSSAWDKYVEPVSEWILEKCKNYI